MLRKILIFVVTVCTLFLGWEWIASSSDSLLFVLPPPSAILGTLWSSRARLLFHTGVTLREMAGGFLLALTVAFPLAWTMLRFKTTRLILQPFFIIIQCLPMFTLAPIMVIWFGWTYTAIMIPTALMIFFPLTLSIYQGLRATPRDLVEFFRTNAATGWQTFMKLRLPYAIPHIFAGFRIAAAIAGIGAVGGEWAGANSGLGILMLESRRSADLEMTFAALTALTLLSTTLYGLVLFAEKFVSKPRRWTLPSFWRKGRFAFSFFLAGTLFLSFVSCQKKPASTRLLLDWLPNPNHIPLYVGLEKGFFFKQGIDLQILKMQESGGGISFLTSGQADLLLNHMPGTLRAMGRGAQLKMVGMLVKQPLSGLIFLKNDTVHSPTDLSGKRLGYCLGCSDTSFLDFLLEKGSIEPAEKYNVSVDLVAAMGTAKVDVIFGAFWNIEPAQLSSLGIETDYFSLEAFDVPSYYEMIFLANAGSPQADPAFTKKFQQALEESLDFCRLLPEEAFACYMRRNPDKREKTLAWERDAWLATLPLLATDQSVDLAALHEFYLWHESRGLLAHAFDPTDLTVHTDR